MASFKHQKLDESNSSAQNKTPTALWFYQQRGDRYYFRFTLLGLVLIVIPIILSLVALASLFFLYKTDRPVETPDVTITAPPAPTDSPTKSIIQPAPPQPTPPQIRNRPMANSNGSAVSLQPGRNSNER